MTATQQATQPRVHRPVNRGAPDQAHLECRTCRVASPCPEYEQIAGHQTKEARP